MTTSVPPINVKRTSSQSKNGPQSPGSPQAPSSPSAKEGLSLKGTPSMLGSKSRISSLLAGAASGGSSSAPSSPLAREHSSSTRDSGLRPKLQQIYGVCSQQGRRPYQEDRAVVHASDAELTAYGVFDGHGGDEVSQLLVAPVDLLGRIQNAVRATASANWPVADALSHVYTTTHKEILARKTLPDTCGSCVVAAVVQHKPDGTWHVHVSNCGDSRCLIYNAATKSTIRLSVDHKPDLPAEQQRIQSRGGAVLSGRLFCGRGATAVSRAIGDRVFAANGLVPDPHVRSARIGQSDAFMMLFSDGLTEQLTDEDVCAIVSDQLSRGATPEQAAIAIVKHAIEHPEDHLQSNDNVTAVVVQFAWV